jgi:hypothetical protein
MSMRNALMAMAAFLGLTAVAGGFGLLEGSLSPDLGQLDGSPFGSYTVPALVLVAIGLVSVAGATLLRIRHPQALRVTAAAGSAIMAFEAVQVLYIDFHWLQPAYFVLGAAMVTLCAIKMLETINSQGTGNSNTPLV